MSRSRYRAVLALSWTLLAVQAVQSGALLAQTTEPPDADETVRMWVEVRDARGRVPDELSPGDLEIREGGTRIVPASVGAQGPERRATGPAPTFFTLYFDEALSGKGTVRRAAQGFVAQARRLTQLGEVEIVMAGDEAESVLSIRDQLVVSERLNWAATNNPGEGRLLELRETVLADVNRLRRSPGSTPEEIAARVRSGIDEEVELVRERLDELLAWATARPPASDGPRVLFLVADGFDLDPLTFYREYLDETAWRLVRRETPTLEAALLETVVRNTARALAASGWTVVPVALEASGGGNRPSATQIENTPTQGPTSTGMGVSVRPGQIFRRRDRDAAEETAVPLARLVEPSEPLLLVAEATGGELVTNERGLTDAVGRFSQRFEITYRSSLGFSGGLRPLQVDALRPGLTAHGPRWRSRAVPESVSALRVKRLLRGQSSGGELDVAAVIEVAGEPDEPGAGELEARLQLTDFFEEDDEDEDVPTRGPRDASFRVTVGWSIPGEEPKLVREVLEDQDLRGLREWEYHASLEVPAEATEVAILVEDLDRGRWGGSRAGVVASPFAGVDGRTPTPPVIALERPEEEILRGRVKFATRVFDQRIARVVFQLDDRDVAEAGRRPFEARVDLGRSPRRQTLTVVAFDPAGVELGRDSVILNAGGVGLQVDIVRPADAVGTGGVEVEASVAVPVERQLDRVLFFWNSDPVATLYNPPFRQTIYIPPELPVGYVRVVAMLDDGTVSEDVLFMNGPGSGERVDVSLVELYVVVTNDEGRPVRGLREQDFLIHEEGKAQDIASFSEASDLPLTLGMAIDSSASMFVKLPGVQQAAIRFLRSTFGEQDRAFVVDFDSQPRLVRATTGRLESVERSIENLEASGRTALWESIVYSLVQLQGVRGRKALIVFSDGADEDDKFPFGSCLSFSKKMGVPIYLILMKREPEPRSGALSLFTRSFKSRVDRLVGTTGGRVFYAKEYENLDEVYADIERELRSQYLLTYYPKAVNGASAWRDVDVEVLARGLRPRTLSGYWP